MNRRYTDEMMAILEEVSGFRQIDSGQIPNIDLYMDQVTTFFEDQLSALKRDEEDKILTKTMINNYIKDGILPAPKKKKYTKEHMMLFAFTYLFKQTLAVNDIKKLLSPIVHDMEDDAEAGTLEKAYDLFLRLQKREYARLAQEMKNGFSELSQAFDQCGLFSNDEYLMIAFSALLVSNAGAMKYVAEKIIDRYLTKAEGSEKGK